MAWNRRLTELLSDVLRFAFRAALLIDGILISISSVWFVWKLCWFTIQYLNRTLFSHPW